MRARWLKPEFFTDKKVAALGPIAALVYQALWCMADDGGTAQCDADTVKAQMFYRWSAVGVPEISEALHALSAVGRIVRYAVGDDTFCTIPTWAEHQQVHKPSKFRHPPMSQGVALEVPGECGTGASPLPASPPPRHLDSQTPRHPSVATAPGGRAVRVLPPLSADAESVVAHYRSVHPSRRPGEKDRKAVVRALKTYSVAELREAIDGNKGEKWAQDNAMHALSWTLRDNASIDKYRELATRVAPPIVDEHGCLTEYGERITRPDRVPA